MAERLTRATFAAHEGECFRLQTDEVEVEWVLVEVSGRGPRAAATPIVATDGELQREPFALLFRGPRQPALPQSIYPLVHDRLGILELFLVPVGEDGDARYYEAVFT